MRWCALVMVLFGACSTLETVAFFDANGDPLTAPVDFGQVELGGSSSALVVAFGSQPWELIDVSRRAGAPVRLLPWLDEAEPVFTFTPPAARFTPEERWKLPVRFGPPVLVDEASYESVLAFTFRGDDGGRKVLLLTVRGHALSFRCGQATPMLFGGLRIGDSLTLDFPLTNLRSTNDTVSFAVEPPTGIFTLDADTPASLFELPAGGEHVVHVTFTPLEARRYDAVAFVQRSSLCPRGLVNLVGSGVHELLTAEPVDLAWTVPGIPLSGELVVENVSRRTVRLTGATLVSGSSAFALTLPQVAGGAGFNGAELNAGTASVPITFTPTTDGLHEATFLISTDAPEQPTVEVRVSGHAGGPDIQLSATELTFPDGGTQYVDVRNLGTRPNPPDSRVNLTFGSPAYQVSSSSQSIIGDVCVGSTDALDGHCIGGLFGPFFAGIASGSSLTVPIRVTPRSPGPRRYEVVFNTNDPDEPSVTLSLVVP